MVVDQDEPDASVRHAAPPANGSPLSIPTRWNRPTRRHRSDATRFAQARRTDILARQRGVIVLAFEPESMAIVGHDDAQFVGFAVEHDRHARRLSRASTR